MWLGRDGTEEAALKILRRSNRTSEPCRRFEREIEVLRGLHGNRGVLPLIDFDLPTDERPFFSMPAAETAAAALTDGSTEEIVRAVESIARTLGRLLSDHDIKHRDVKPTNLYRYDDRWVVGDFGLIEIPSVEDLTARDRFVGPAYFIAFDIMQNPIGADYAAGDVFALAKTLWVLLVGQRWPSPGPHRADRGQDSLYIERPHRHAAALDRILAAATERRPGDRLTMGGFANELAAWLELDEDSSDSMPDDLSEITARLRRRISADVSGAEREKRWRPAALEDEAYMLAALPAFYETLRQIRSDFDEHASDAVMRTLLSRERADNGMLWESVSTARLAGPGDFLVHLRLGRSIHLYRGGAVRSQGGFSLGFDGESPLQQWSTLTDPAPAGSIASRQQIEGLRTLLRGQLGRWLKLLETAL